MKKTFLATLIVMMSGSMIALAGEDSKLEIRNYGMLQRCPEGDKLLAYPMLNKQGDKVALKEYPMLNKRGEDSLKGHAPWR